MDALNWALLGAALLLAFLVVYLWRMEREKRRLLRELEALLARPELSPQFSLREGSFAILENSLKELVARLGQERMLRTRESQQTSESLMRLSHQLKTPLSALRMYEELAPGPYSEKQIQLMQRMEHLMDMLLQLEKLRSGGYAMRFAQTELATPLLAAWARLKPLWPQVNLKIVGSAAARLDPDWMEEAFINLLKNACEHLPIGGQVLVHLMQTQSAVHIQLEDTGGGVPEQDLPRLFERFFVSSSRQGGGGAGIGLSMVQQIIWAHHGEIEAQNTSQGLRFLITLPDKSAHLIRL